MIEQFLLSLEDDLNLSAGELRVSRATVAALAFIIWDVLIHLSTEVDIIWHGHASSWVRWTYAFMRYVPVVTLSSLIVIITSVTTHVAFTERGCRAWQIWQTVATLSLIWVVDAIFILRLYAVYGRSKIILWLILALYAAEIGAMLFGSITSIVDMHLTPGCLILSYPTTYYACWLSALSFQTVLIILMAINFFRAKHRHSRGHAILRIVFRDGSWAYALIFLVTLANSTLHQISHPSVAGTPYAWAIALYSFAGCHLQMNIYKKEEDVDDIEPDIYPPFTSHIELTGVSIDDSTDFATPIHFELPV